MRWIVITALALSSLSAQQYPDGETLTRQAAATIKKLHSLQYKEAVTMETPVNGQTVKIETETTRALLNPGKTRFETHAQGMTMIVVSDGETTWMYSSLNNEYTKKSAGIGPAGMMDAMGIGDLAPSLKNLHMTQKTTGEEPVAVDGVKHDCWVVTTDIGEMDLPAPGRGAKISSGKMTTWIDKKLGIDLQNDTSMKMEMGANTSEIHIKSVKKDLQIDGPIAPSTFTFAPPEGAKEVAKLELFGGAGVTADLTGTAAADFTLQSLDGKTYKLSEMKGKPVLLDFWATWCGPCRKSMPALEKVAKDYKDQGLMVLGVNAGEERDLVTEFMKTTPMAYPGVLAGDSSVLKDYQVSALPTFVLIGGDGKIVAYESGFGGDEMLAAMLAKAGLSKK
jgi:thiol-disulfide isomerase/thioredoxin